MPGTLLCGISFPPQASSRQVLLSYLQIQRKGSGRLIKLLRITQLLMNEVTQPQVVLTAEPMLLLILSFHVCQDLMGEGLWKDDCWVPPPLFSYLVVLRGAQEYAFLTSAHVVGASATNLRTTLTIIILCSKCVFELTWYTFFYCKNMIRNNNIWIIIFLGLYKSFDLQ